VSWDKKNRQKDLCRGDGGSSHQKEKEPKASKGIGGGGGGKRKNGNAICGKAPGEGGGGGKEEFKKYWGRGKGDIDVHRGTRESLTATRADGLKAVVGKSGVNKETRWKERQGCGGICKKCRNSPNTEKGGVCPLEGKDTGWLGREKRNKKN